VSVHGPPQRSRVLTIAATYGAGGGLVAPRLAERLGLPFLDRLIPARDPVPAPATTGREQLSEEEHDLTPRGRFLVRLGLLTAGLGLPNPNPDDVHFQERVRTQVEASIQRAVEEGGGVILGRGAALVLAGHPRAFHVRLDGPADRRVAQGMALEGIDEVSARRRQVETDKARARYVAEMYHRDATDPRLYHLMIDSTAIPLDTVVELIADGANAYWAGSVSGGHRR
jgi:hypothetical protein